MLIVVVLNTKPTAGVIVSNHRYRCSRNSCRTRVTLKKCKELYIKEPKCKVCGGNLHSVEKERKDYSRKMKCTCDGLHYPHQRGTKWCNYYEGTYTEDELKERHLI